MTEVCLFLKIPYQVLLSSLGVQVKTLYFHCTSLHPSLYTCVKLCAAPLKLCNYLRYVTLCACTCVCVVCVKGMFCISMDV